jgi:hypothetical protein
MPEGFWLQTTITVIVSLFGGGGVLVLWEGLIKPRRERKSLEAGLAAEIHHAAQYMKSHLELADHQRRRVPPDFHVSTTIYRSVAARLGDLSGEQLGRVVPLYRQFEELNRIPSIYASYVQGSRSGDPVDRSQAQDESDLCMDTFYRMLGRVHAHATIVRPLVGPKPASLPLDLRAQEIVLAADAHTREVKARIKTRGRGEG